jgi:uncharacterized small protein (DUF1192 family)
MRPPDEHLKDLVGSLLMSLCFQVATLRAEVERLQADLQAATHARDDHVSR